MAAASGRQSAAMSQPELQRLLEREPWSVEFFQAVQALERIYPDREVVGAFVHPAREVVRFAVSASLAFPASEIQSIEWREDGPPLIVVNFMGLTGPVGVLPHVYTLLLIERRWARDRALQEFLDIFHHRAISLFYRAWRKYRIAANYETGQDQFTQYLRDFVGLGTKGLESRQAVPDQSLLYYAGLLMLQPRSAACLENLLTDYFGAKVSVEQFVGAWYTLPKPAQCEMCDEERISRQLGFGAVAGDQIWDRQSKVRLRIGPLTLKRYREFLPGGRAFAALEALTRFYSCQQFDFEVQLALARGEVPELELGAEGEAALPLGLCTWAKTGPFDYDPDDAILSLGEQRWA
jgi:type VI secretion system protein ImpH